MKTSTAKIVVDAYSLALAIFRKSSGFPKYYRPTLGRRLEDGGLNLTLAVRIASLTSGKDGLDRRKKFLDRSSEHLDEIRIILQMCHELSIIPASGYADLSELTSEIGRQIGGLTKFCHAGGQSELA